MHVIISQAVMKDIFPESNRHQTLVGYAWSIDRFKVVRKGTYTMRMHDPLWNSSGPRGEHNYRGIMERKLFIDQLSPCVALNKFIEGCSKASEACQS